MTDDFLTASSSQNGSPKRAHQWAPPEHPDVTLFTSAQAPEADRDDAVALDAPVPVWVELDYAEIGHLKTHGFAIAASDRAVLVDTTWQGRLQKAWVPRTLVTHQPLKPRGHVDAEVQQMRKQLAHTGERRR